MRSNTNVNLGIYNARPNPSMADVANSSNIGRSRVTESYHGYNGQLDSNIIDGKSATRPKVRRVADEIFEAEISRSGAKRKACMVKEYQTIYSALDISNLNSEYDPNNKTYTYTVTDNKFYKNSFGKTGLEQIYEVQFSPISVPTYFQDELGFDLSRLYLDINLSESTGNKNFGYTMSYYPDNNASTVRRRVLVPHFQSFKLNGFSSLNNINLRIRDVASYIDIPNTEIEFTVATIGNPTILSSLEHGLVSGMFIYMKDCNNRRNIFPRIYEITVIDENDIFINVDTSVWISLVGQKVIFVIDDWVFHTQIGLLSTKEDVK
jgi:hypothetical protein